MESLSDGEFDGGGGGKLGATLQTATAFLCPCTVSGLKVLNSGCSGIVDPSKEFLSRLFLESLGMLGVYEMGRTGTWGGMSE